jgi:LAS superfamily LD-carboxypeptidase LdcB
VVPAKALEEAGRIRLIAVDQTGQSKHEFHALSQTARMQYEDGDLLPIQLDQPIRIGTDEEDLLVEEGLVIIRKENGEIVLLSNAPEPVRKYLEAAHRFCTRWVRLDL